MDKVTRPQNAISLYPQNSDGTTVSVNVTSSVINLKYISTATQTKTVSYISKTAEEVCLEINSLNIPVKAVPTIRNTRFSSGDLLITNTASYFNIPTGFPIFDRLSNRGIVIRTNKYTVKHKQLANFKLLQPYSNSILLPWYPVISNGEFSVRDSGRTFKFRIPEYDSQVWSIRYGKPFKDVIGEQITPFKNGVYKVSRTPIFWNGENIKLYNEDILISPSSIEDIDTNNGLIYIKPGAAINSNSRIDYTYLENNYEYTALNINGHITQNPNLLDKFVLIYAIPLEGINYSINKRTIYHKIADSVDEAINSIESDSRNNPIVVIGGYSIQQVMSSDRVSILDTRSKGGGLVSPDGPVSSIFNSDSISNISTNEVAIEDGYRESKFFFDIGVMDGEVYPGAGCVIIEVPQDAKDILHVSDIKNRATKFLAAGVLPIFSFYDRPLPAVSGLSSQISLLMNGGMLEAYNSGVGNCWTRFPVSLPGHASTGTWSTIDDDLLPNISRKDNTGVISSTPSYGVYQSYLKSTPIAGIEYYTREVNSLSGSKDDQYTYSSWKRIRLVDDREVPNGQLVKGYISFPKSLNTSEFRSITINSPFRTDLTGQLKADIADEIDLINTAILSRTTEIEFNSAISSTESGTYTGRFITHDLSSIDQQLFIPCPDYEGVSRAYDYLFNIHNSDLSGSFSGQFDVVGRQLINVLGDSTYTGRMKFFSIATQNYKDYSTTTSDIDISIPIEQLSTYGFWRKETFGTGDYLYNQICNKMTGILSNHNITVNGYYYPKEYTYYISTPGDPPDFVSGLSFKIPEISGFSPAEVIESNNDDYDYLYTTPSIIGASRLIDNFNGAFATGIMPIMLTAWSGIAEAMTRLPDSIIGTRTKDGFPIVQHWYNPYNRYGRYAGSLSKQLINCYESLYLSQTSATTGVTWNGSPGIDVRTLSNGFGYISDTLDIASTGFAETILRGGILDPYTPDLLYGYGWYVNNYTGQSSYISGYSPTTSFPNHVARFSGIFHSGLNTLIKGMTTINGDILETTIVDGAQGPFQVKVPAKIFDTLAMACMMDKNKYLPLTQAVFNTVKNKYGSEGFYYLDPLKAVDYAGQEDILSPCLARLYKTL